MDIVAMRQIGEAILAEPRKFNMDALWVEEVGKSKDLLPGSHSKNALPPCGTVACFAGEWAIVNNNCELPIGARCQSALDLPNERLFYQHAWPSRLQSPLKAGTRRYAEHFVKVVLEDYIATNGWEDES